MFDKIVLHAKIKVVIHCGRSLMAKRKLPKL